MNIDYVEFLARLLNVFRNSLRKLDGAKTIRPPLFRQQIFKKQWLHAVSQLIQFLRQVVDNPCDPGLGFPLRSRYHQNPHRGVASFQFKREVSRIIRGRA